MIKKLVFIIFASVLIAGTAQAGISLDLSKTLVAYGVADSGDSISVYANEDYGYGYLSVSGFFRGTFFECSKEGEDIGDLFKVNGSATYGNLEVNIAHLDCLAEEPTSTTGRKAQPSIVSPHPVTVSADCTANDEFSIHVAGLTTETFADFTQQYHSDREGNQGDAIINADGILYYSAEGDYVYLESNQIWFQTGK